MNEIRPIETYYDGHWYRSRLEARWAVVFNYLGVDFEYEPEGFDLGNGLKYLPDFRVKCYGKRGDYKSDPFDLYIEVKGRMTEIDAEKIKRFCGEETKVDEEYGYEYAAIHTPILIVNQIPGPGLATCFDLSENMGFDLYPFNYYLIDGDYFGAYPAATADGKFYLFGDDSNYINWKDEKRMELAYEAARCARFEHGAMPPTRAQFDDMRWKQKYHHTHCDPF